MPTEKTWQIHSQSSVDTEAYGEAMGRALKGGEVLEFISDLGGGKTTFVRGLARGAGSSDRVASPTFTISREYRAPKFTIIHVDFYRLDEAGIVAEELREYMGNTAYVVVVEWGEIAKNVLPQHRLTVQIHHVAQQSEARDITCSAPPELGYLQTGVQA